MGGEASQQGVKGIAPEHATKVESRRRWLLLNKRQGLDEGDHTLVPVSWEHVVAAFEWHKRLGLAVRGLKHSLAMLERDDIIMGTVHYTRWDDDGCYLHARYV